ncbi:MAG: 50S ribosomal protein L10 [Victivallales bacterium]|nr:50S ribosomal protein L10 [Victivallales bacterium]
MRIEKTQMLRDIAATLEDSDYIFLMSYKGLKVEDFSQLRGSLAGIGARCQVIKNRLVRKAAESSGLEQFGRFEFRGDTAMVSGKGDAYAVARLISDFSKKSEFVAPKNGYADGEVLTSSQVLEIASLPSRDILLAQLLGLLNAPARSLVGVLHAKTAQVVYLLNSYKDKKEKQ